MTATDEERSLRHGDRRFWLIASNYVIAAQGAITGPIVARMLGPEGRGQTATVQTAVFITATLGTIGLVAALNGRPSTFNADTLWRASARWRRLILAITCIAVPVAYAAAVLVDLPHPWVVAVCALVVVFSNPSVTAKTGVFLATGHYRRLFWGRTVASGLLIAGLTVNALLGGSALIVIALYMLTGAVPAFVPLPKPDATANPADVKRVRDFLRADIPPVAAQAFLNTSNSRIDQTILPTVLDNRDLGLYSVSVTWGSLAGPLSSALSSALMRTTARATPHARPLVPWRSVGVLALASSLLAVTGVWGLPIVFGSDYKGSILPAAILCLAGWLLCIVSLLNGQLVAMGRSRAIFAGEVVALLTVPLALPMATAWGIVGAAAASCICYGANCLLLIVRYRSALRDVPKG